MSFIKVGIEECLSQMLYISEIGDSHSIPRYLYARYCRARDEWSRIQFELEIILDGRTDEG